MRFPALLLSGWQSANGLIGKTSAVRVIATRKARVKGNLAKLFKYTGAINRFVEVMQGLPNEFEGTL